MRVAIRFSPSASTRSANIACLQAILFSCQYEWGAGFSFLIITYLHKGAPVDWPIIFSILGVGILFRQSTAVFLIPLLMLYISQQKSQLFSLDGFSRSLKDLYPCVIFAPFLIRVLLFGNPAFTDAPDPFAKVFELPSLIQIDAINQMFPIIYLIFVIVCFSMSLENKNGLKMFLLFTFILNVFMYSSTSVGVWDNPKYIFEWCLPFVVFGILLCVNRFLESFSQSVRVTLLAAFILTNLFVFDRLPASAFRLFPNFHFETAMADVSKQDGIGNTLIIGPTYGVLQHVIYGATVEETALAAKIYDDWQTVLGLGKNEEGKAEGLASIEGIKYVLVTDWPGMSPASQKFFLTQLVKLGWQKSSEYADALTSQKLLLFTKNST